MPRLQELAAEFFRGFNPARMLVTGALGERDQAITLRCDTPRSVRFELHPIATAGRAVGSTVAVLMPDLRRVLLVAVLETGGSRIYYSRACRTR